MKELLDFKLRIFRIQEIRQAGAMPFDVAIRSVTNSRLSV